MSRCAQLEKQGAPLCLGSHSGASVNAASCGGVVGAQFNNVRPLTVAEDLARMCDKIGVDITYMKGRQSCSAKFFVELDMLLKLMPHIHTVIIAVDNALCCTSRHICTGDGSEVRTLLKRR